MEEKRHRTSKSIQLLLLDDVDELGRSGDVVNVKPGFARNFLVPKGKGIVADKFTLKMRARLQEEREKQSVVDKASAEQFASQINGLALETKVKVDPDGHMYGSVGAGDLVEILAGEGISVEKRWVRLHQPIKTLGFHEIECRLKEGVTCSFKVAIVAEGVEEAPAV